MNSPTQRSLELLREQGYTVAIVEHWNQFAGVRQDLFGFLDIVAIKESERGVLGVQTTSVNNLSARLGKSLVLKNLKIWLSAGNRYIIHGWGLKGKKGERKLMACTQKEVTLKDLSAMKFYF